MSDRFNRIARRIVGVDMGLMDAVTGFFAENPNPNDEQFHEWAEENGLDVHEAEEAAYVLATLMARFVSGGKAREKGINSTDVDPDELAMGVKVEMEHTPDPLVAGLIALDHLAEIPDYYARLAKMEKEAGVEH